MNNFKRADWEREMFRTYIPEDEDFNMTMTDYPLCKQMGLPTVEMRSWIDGIEHALCVKADDLEAKLAAAPVVYGHMRDDGHFYVPDPRLGLRSGTDMKDTHTARLLCVSEIKRDTAESLLREYISMPEVVSYAPFRDWKDRVRKLLASIGVGI